ARHRRRRGRPPGRRRRRSPIPSTSGSSASAGSTSSAPSATSRAGSTTSCAAGRAGRGTPARRGSTSRSRTTCSASSAPSGSRGSWSASGWWSAIRANTCLSPAAWDLSGLTEAVYRQFDLRVDHAEYKEVTSRDALAELVGAAVTERYRQREQEFGAALTRAIERREMLIVIDYQWKDHLLSIDHLKEGIGLRGYGQRDPLTEYKREAFDLFQDM